MITENYTDYSILDNEEDKKKFEKLTIGSKILSIHFQTGKGYSSIFFELDNRKTIQVTATNGDFNSFVEFYVLDTDELENNGKSVLEQIMNGTYKL